MVEVLVHKLRSLRRALVIVRGVALPAFQCHRVNFHRVPRFPRFAAFSQHHDDGLAVRVPVCIACNTVVLFLALPHDLLGAVHRPDEHTLVPPAHPAEQPPTGAEFRVFPAVRQPPLALTQARVRLMQIVRQPVAVYAQPPKLFQIVSVLYQHRAERSFRAPRLPLNVLAPLPDFNSAVLHDLAPIDRYRRQRTCKCRAGLVRPSRTGKLQSAVHQRRRQPKVFPPEQPDVGLVQPVEQLVRRFRPQINEHPKPMSPAVLALPQPVPEAHLPEVFRRRILAVQRQIPRPILQSRVCSFELTVLQARSAQLLLTRQCPDVRPAVAGEARPAHEIAVFHRLPVAAEVLRIFPDPLARAALEEYIPGILICRVLAIEKIRIHPHLQAGHPDLTALSALKKVERERAARQCLAPVVCRPARSMDIPAAARAYPPFAGRSGGMRLGKPLPAGRAEAFIPLGVAVRPKVILLIPGVKPEKQKFLVLHILGDQLLQLPAVNRRNIVDLKHDSRLLTADPSNPDHHCRAQAVGFPASRLPPHPNSPCKSQPRP